MSESQSAKVKFILGLLTGVRSDTGHLPRVHVAFLHSLLQEDHFDRDHQVTLQIWLPFVDNESDSRLGPRSIRHSAKHHELSLTVKPIVAPSGSQADQLLTAQIVNSIDVAVKVMATALRKRYDESLAADAIIKWMIARNRYRKTEPSRIHSWHHQRQANLAPPVAAPARRDELISSRIVFGSVDEMKSFIQCCSSLGWPCDMDASECALGMWEFSVTVSHQGDYMTTFDVYRKAMEFKGAYDGFSEGG